MNRKNSPILLACLIVLLVGAWMGSRHLTQESAEASPSTEPPAPEIMDVQAVRLTSEEISRMLTIQGELEPVRTATLRSETDGQVETISAERGSFVSKGQVMIELKIKNRAAKLKEAEALVKQRIMDFQAKKELFEKDLVAEITVKEAKAALESAQAILDSIKLEIADTKIRAPFDGVLEKRNVELGDLVGVQGEVGLLVDNSSLIAVGHVPQQEIEHLRAGKTGMVRFITGHEARGRIRYVASMPDEGTQTFRIELVVDNSDRRLPSGVSAEIAIPLEDVEAHFISPAALVLGENGQVGVKTVDPQSRVRFHPVRIVRSEGGGMWVTGLPDNVAAIITGQGFVAPGEKVAAVFSENALSGPRP